MFYIVIDMRGRVNINNALLERIGVTRCSPDFNGLEYEGPVECVFSNGTKHVPRKMLLFLESFGECHTPIDFEVLIREHSMAILAELLCLFNGTQGVLTRKPYEDC